MTDNTIATRDNMPAPQQSETAQAITVQMIGAIERVAKDPDFDVDKLDRFLALQERLMAKQAEQAFNRAMVDLQAELEPIVCDAEIHGKAEGRAPAPVRSRFAKHETIMEYLRPKLTRHGFAITRSQETNGDITTEHLTVMHREGHSRTNSFSVRTKGGPPGTSVEQGSGSAAKYAFRYALRDAFDLVYIEPEQAEDATRLGATLDPETAAALRERVRKVCKKDEMRERKFLAWAGADVPAGETILPDHYEKIHEGRVQGITKWLKEKEAGQ